MVTTGMDADAIARFEAYLSPPPPPAPVTDLEAERERLDRIASIESAGGEVIAG